MKELYLLVGQWGRTGSPYSTVLVDWACIRVALAFVLLWSFQTYTEPFHPLVQMLCVATLYTDM